MLTQLELLNCLELGLIFGLAALGVYLTYRIIDFPDMTVDGSFTLGAAIIAIFATRYSSPLAGMVIAFIGGGLSGIVTGFLNTRFKIQPLLASIITASGLYSVNLRIMGGLPNIALDEPQTIFADQDKLLLVILICFGIWGLVSLFLNTELGLAVRATGFNQSLARNYGVRTNMVRVSMIALSNGIVALSGAIFAQVSGFADISMGLGTIIAGLAAVIIGEKLIPVRSVSIALGACFVGSIIYRLIMASALNIKFLGLTASDINLISALFIIIFMIAPRFKGGNYAQA